jgi:hypothetical protein
MTNLKKRFLLTSATLLSLSLANVALAADGGSTNCNSKATTYARYTCLASEKSGALPGSESLVKLQKIIEELQAVQTAIKKSNAASPAPAPVAVTPVSKPKTFIDSAIDDALDLGSAIGNIAASINPFKGWF